MKKRTVKNLKTAAGLWLRLLGISVMCLILTMSLSAVTEGMLAREVGYEIQQLTDENEWEIKEQVYYKDGDPIVDGSQLELKENERFQVLRETSNGLRNAMDIITLLLCLALLGLFPYNQLWQLGNKDENRVRYQHSKADPLRGLKIGLLTMVPAMLLYVGLIVAQFTKYSKVFLVIYRFLNVPFWSYFGWVLGMDITAVEALSVGQHIALFLPVLFVPAICYVAYTLGFKQFSIGERMTYKKQPEEEQEI